MAARETGIGAVEQYMHQGKLLALELLVRVFDNPSHHWDNVKPEVGWLSWVQLAAAVMLSSLCS